MGLLELSYDILPEDAQRFEPAPPEGVGHRERAAQLYGAFSHEEKLALLDQKIEMLQAKQQRESDGDMQRNITTRLLEELQATRLAVKEAETAAPLKAAARAARGRDPPGMTA